MLISAIAAVVIVVLLVLVLALTGVLSPGSSGSSAASFAGSRGSAQSVANGAAGGPWTLLLAVGIATQGTYTGSASNVTGIAGSVSGSQCTYTPAPGAPSSLSAPGVGNVSLGNAGAWLYLYTNTTGSVLLVTVTGGAATLLGTIAGSSCDLASSGFTAIPSSGIIDSTTASADAGAAGGYAFLSAHPTANATFALIGGYSILGTSIGATWVVEYLSCALSGPGPASAPSFLAVLSATTGDVLEARASTVTCPSTSSNPPLSSVLALSYPSEAATGSHYWYNFSVEAAGGGLIWADTSFTVQTPGGQTVSLPTANATVLGITGNTVATFSFASGLWVGSSASNTGVTSADVISIESSVGLSSDSFVVQGSGGYSGQISVVIH